jgi:5'-3' exonuclease
MKPNPKTSKKAIQKARSVVDKLEKILNTLHIKIPEKTRRNPEKESAIFGQVYINLLHYLSRIFEFWDKQKGG